MGRFTYYTPALIGALLVLGQANLLFEQPRVAALSESARWAVLVAACVANALLFQLLMVGAQGAFAQVLPVPKGRSIRGRAAVVTGALIIGSVALAMIAGLLQFEAIQPAATWVWSASAACAIAAIVLYGWQAPLAPRDFADR
ncbi:MAG: hypothetical protein D6744_17260 [Planctomycetota bacterium]|nr:MAG: hypothetical protein D6744_17260 [Planctomycetota bacterium]